VLVLWVLPKWQTHFINEPKDRFSSENEARKTVAQILGSLVLIGGFYFTWKNLALTTKSQAEGQRIAIAGPITDRFTKAISQLGDARLEIRLGGIYALERIAKDSAKDHWPIMEVLTTFVREHARCNLLADASPRPEGESLKPATDIQAILTVIGRRLRTSQNGEDQRLDLSHTCLSGVFLVRANLMGADLNGTDLTKAVLFEADLGEARLRGAVLVEANLTGASLQGAYLSGADLRVADLSGANLKHAELSGVILTGTKEHFAPADFSGAKLTHAVLNGAVLYGTNLLGADLRWAKGLTTEQLERATGDDNTQLPEDMPRPKSWQQDPSSGPEPSKRDL